MDDHPLVVPGREPARLREDVHRVGQLPLLADVIDRMVVEEQEGAVQPRDDQVLVVARIADDRASVRAARQVLEGPAALHLELDVVGGVVELLLRDRPGAVDRVQVERRRAEVARVGRIGGLCEPRCGVEGHVVVDELAEEGRPRRVAGVVGIVGAQRGVDDQRLGSRRQRIGGVQQAAGPAQLAQRRLDLRRLPRERRQPEDPPEVLGAGRRRVGAGPVPRRPRRCGDGARGIERHGARSCAHGAQKSPAAEPVALVFTHHCPLVTCIATYLPVT